MSARASLDRAVHCPLILRDVFESAGQVAVDNSGCSIALCRTRPAAQGLIKCGEAGGYQLRHSVRRNGTLNAAATSATTAKTAAAQTQRPGK